MCQLRTYRASGSILPLSLVEFEPSAWQVDFEPARGAADFEPVSVDLFCFGSVTAGLRTSLVGLGWLVRRGRCIGGVLLGLHWRSWRLHWQVALLGSPAAVAAGVLGTLLHWRRCMAALAA